MNVGVIGLGYIASRLTETINEIKEVNVYAVGSRNLNKAKEFANKYNINKYYGSYEDLVRDNNIDLIYIATPHSEHYENIKLCLNNNKNVLCEKAFTVNSKQAIEVIKLAKNKKLLLAEAIWTRYMPFIEQVKEEINKLGGIKSINCNLCYQNMHIDRLVNPKLAGGSLLDLGVYTLNFVFAFLGNDYKRITSTVKMTDTNVDESSNIMIEYDKTTAYLFNSMNSNSDKKGVINCNNGFIEIYNITNPTKILIFDYDYNVIKELEIKKQITGYEYQVLSCLNALKNNQIECIEFNHKDIIDIMKTMDKLRSSWELKYPCE